MKTTAIISFSAATSLIEDFALEQKDWPEMSAAGFEAWLAQRGIDPSAAQSPLYYEQYRSTCDEDGQLVATLRVRLHDLTTQYTLRASYGQIGPPVLVSEGRQDYVAFELTAEQSIDFGDITGVAWQGPVYDALGELIAAPEVHISGRSITVDQPVYGVLAVAVVEQLYSHTLTIDPRTPTAEQAERIVDGEVLNDELYASTAMLFCQQRISLLEVAMPQYFGTCAGITGYAGRVIEDEPTDGQLYTVTFSAFDYCSGSTIADPQYWVDGQLIQGAQATLTSGPHTLVVTATGYTPSDEDDLTDNDTFTLPSS